MDGGVALNCRDCKYWRRITPEPDTLGRCLHPEHPMATPERFGRLDVYQECTESDDTCAKHEAAVEKWMEVRCD